MRIAIGEFPKTSLGSIFSLGVFLFFVASWCKKDPILSRFSFESIRCNLKLVLLSREHDHVIFQINEYLFADKKFKLTIRSTLLKLLGN